MTGNTNTHDTFKLLSAVCWILAGINLLISPLNANAVPLEDATEVRASFNFPNGKGSSIDGPGFDAFLPFASFVAPELLKVNAFTGQALGSILEFTLLSEVGAFDGTTPAFANNFGVVNDQGDFVSVLNTVFAAPGSTGSLTQDAGEAFKFALLSPEGLFTTDDASNPDGAAHILAMEVTKAGDFVINPTSLRGTAPLAFSFLEGDLVLFIEDLRAIGNLTSSLVPASGDFDYNDFVVVVRQSQVPEPGTLGLLGLGLLAGRYRRKRSA